MLVNKIQMLSEILRKTMYIKKLIQIYVDIAIVFLLYRNVSNIIVILI